MGIKNWRSAMTDKIATLGIDLGKNWFHLIGINDAGKVVFRKRMNRNQLAEFAVSLPACLVAMESCPGSQYW
jgi:transposase